MPTAYYSEIYTAPPVEPITLAELKDYLRITHSDLDSQLASIIVAARQTIEEDYGIYLVEQVISTWYRCFPSSGEGFILPHGPVRSILILRYQETDMTYETVSSSVYDFVNKRYSPNVILKYGQSWPSCTLNSVAYPVWIRANCGFASTGDSPNDYRANIPQQLKQAIMVQCDLLFNRPSGAFASQQEAVYKRAIESLVFPYIQKGF